MGAANAGNFDLLGAQTFSVNVELTTMSAVPETGTIVYVGSVLAAWAAARRRFRGRSVVG